MEIKAGKSTKKLGITKTTGEDFAARTPETGCSSNFIRLIIPGIAAIQDNENLGCCIQHTATKSNAKSGYFIPGYYNPGYYNPGGCNPDCSHSFYRRKSPANDYISGEIK